jgi:hypothetical protein
MAPTGGDERRRLATFTQILARLKELPNYCWDADVDPIHSVRARSHITPRLASSTTFERPS